MAHRDARTPRPVAERLHAPRPQARASLPGAYVINWAISVFLIAIVAALFGFTGIAGGAATVAKFLFVLFLLLFLVLLVVGLIRR